MNIYNGTTMIGYYQEDVERSGGEKGSQDITEQTILGDVKKFS